MVENLRIFDPDKDELVTRGAFECKVVGVSLHNADGSDRQEIIRAHCEIGTRLLLLPEPENPVDANAIRVCVLHEAAELQIGYLKANLAAIITDGLRSNVYPYATAIVVSGGGRGKPSLGVISEVELRAEHGVSPNDWLKRQRQRANTCDEANQDETKSTHHLSAFANADIATGAAGGRGMTRYQNRSGDSGVTAFDIGDDYIKLRFRSQRKVYVYTRSSVGAKHLKEMKRLATLGKGLSSYVNRHVHGRYDRIE